MTELQKTSAPPLPPGAPQPLNGFWPAGRPVGAGAASVRQTKVMSWQALSRRIGLGVGPTPARWSTYPNDELTPEKIIKLRKEAHSGYPWRWADLVEQQIENNSHIRSLMHFRRAWAMSDVITWRIDPPKEFENDEAAQFVAAWQSAVLNQPSLRNIWSDQIYQLLSASAYGYAAAELFWDWRQIEFTHKGKEYSVRSYVPYHMEFVHQKSFRFDLDTDEPGLYTADSTILKWPMGKILFHRCLGDGITERRGWMTAGIWILLGLQQGWQDLLIYMHRYGIPQIAVFTDRELLDQGEERNVLESALDNWGEGQTPVFLNEHRIEQVGAVSSSGETIHPKVIEIAKADLSVLVTGSILAQSQGSGTGSYGASDQHAITAHVYRVPDGTKLAADISGGMLDPMLHYNLEGLAEASGHSADAIRRRSGVFGWKANGPAPTVTDIIAQAKDLDAMGFPISQRELSQRSGWSIGEGKDRLPGKSMHVDAGGSVIGSSLAGTGFTAPIIEPQQEAAQ